VPYGFQKNGFPLLLPSRLANLAPIPHWHLMFHEIWVGITRVSPIKHKIVGFFQRRIAKKMVRLLRPKVIHTSNPLYLELLSRAGIKAKRLPLFGNICLDNSQNKWMKACLLENGIAELNRQDWLIAGMFGSCYPGYPLEDQVRKIAVHAVKSGKKTAFLGIGSGIGTGRTWEMRVKNAAPTSIVRHYNWQEQSKVSAFLASLDIAMLSTPAEFLGKSGTAASMALHGAVLDTSYRVDMPEYRQLHLADWPQDDLFWPLEKVAAEMESSLAASAALVLSK
jgi:hypothetical protein